MFSKINNSKIVVFKNISKQCIYKGNQIITTYLFMYSTAI